MDEFREEEAVSKPTVQERESKPEELEKATLSIGQRQWAVSCAEDPLHILETARLGSCFALIFYETEKKMGAMAHISREPDFNEVFDKMMVLLDENGGQNYRVILVNCDFTGKSMIKRGEELKQAVEQKQEELKEKKKLGKDFEYVSGKEASFDLKAGDFCPFAISQKTIEAQKARQRELYTPDVEPKTLVYQLIYTSDIWYKIER